MEVATLPGNPPPNKQTAAKAKRVARAQRKHQVLQLAVAGASNAQIAETLGMREAGVQSIILKQLERWKNSDMAAVENVRALQLRRIDDLVRRLHENVRKADDSVNLGVIDRITRLEQLRARVAGTEQARKFEVSGSIGHHMERGEVDRLEQAWLTSGGDVIDGDAEELPDGDAD